MNKLKSLYRYLLFNSFKKLQILSKKKNDILFKDLYSDGFVHLKDFLNPDLLSKTKLQFEVIKKKYPNNHFWTEKIDNDFEDEIFKTLSNRNLLQLIKDYLGNKILFYENLFMYTGTPESNENTWVPHHDTKGNRLKFYFWIDSDQKSHPLFYKKGSHKIFKKWSNSEETFYKELDTSIKRLYVNHLTIKGKDVYFPKPPLYFEFKNDKMLEFGVIKPGFSNLIFKRFENGQKFVKKEKIFPTTKSK